MDGYHNSETFMSDLNALIYGHQIKMAGIFAKRDVVSKLLHEQITLCDSLAKSIAKLSHKVICSCKSFETTSRLAKMPAIFIW